MQLLFSFAIFAEVDVEEEHLGTFLGLSKELRLKGLVDSCEIVDKSGNKGNRKESDPVSTDANHSYGNLFTSRKKESTSTESEYGNMFTMKKSESKPEISHPPMNEDFPTEEESFPKESDRSTKIYSEIFDDIRNAKDHRQKESDTIVKEELQQLDDQIKTMMEVAATHFVTIQGNKQRNWRCKVCGKEAKKTNIIGHIEVHHITSNVVHSCDICGKVSRSRGGLRRHKSRDGCRDHKAAFTAFC